MIPPDHTATGWDRFITQLFIILRLVLWVLACLFVSRAVLVWFNRHTMQAGAAPDFIHAFFVGMKFDARIAALLVVPLLGIALACLKWKLETLARRISLGAGYLFTILWLLLGTVTLGYFREYHNQFDPNVLGVIYDDFGAVLHTIWKTYPVVRGVIVLVTVGCLLCFLMGKWLRADIPRARPGKPRGIAGGLAWGILITACLVIGVRGKIKGRPMQEKDAGCTGDPVLNRCVVNPFFALHYAIRAHLRLLDAGGMEQFLKEKELKAAMREFAGPAARLETVDDVFLKTASGPSGPRPKHIFLVVLESFDGWTMMPKHSAWGLAPEMNRLAREGAQVARFVAASRSTMTSLASIISGLADCGVITNERSRPGQAPFGTAIAPQMEALGYETHFFYAGLGSWQRLEDFAKEQGFRHTHMGPAMTRSPGSNEWGVTDRDLYRHIEATIRPGVPSFSVIMTTSNHRPYTIDLAAEGCEVKVPPKGYETFAEGNATPLMLGHHLYSDKCAGEFVTRMETRAPGCFFALTADHWGRGFPGPRPTLTERALVPLVLWQKGRTFPDFSNVGGSHYDLGATLIEMVAPAGTPYRAIGRNLLGTDPPRHALSRLWDIGPGSIVSMSDNEGMETTDGKPLTEPPPGFAEQQRRYNLVHGISWWRLIKGNKLPE